jgi:serine/threonine-protein kinase
MSERDDPGKTVFQPSRPEPSRPEPAAPSQPATEDAGAEWPAASGGEWTDAPAASEGEWAAAPASEPPPQPAGWDDPGPARTTLPPSMDTPPSAAPPPPHKTGRIAPGEVLNHIFEVRRFIARGGMGEVYEGVNVLTDERVAIKVMLEHLARDPNVQAMFRKEARTLTRLTHPALVQYRVLAEEPELGVLYIVTEYIDGSSLEDMIGRTRPTAQDLVELTRRLASGLQTAHELGAIHRDIAPDNVLLQEGRLDKPKVIDFGIAKDLDPSNKTIVGDGFAGKLGFVAPEQFGDYNREIGPWTDVYSLALVVLALASGKPADMGATLVEAIDKRRQGPDLSGVPDEIRPVLAAMLKPDPAERLRSMGDVIAMLDHAPVAAPAAAAARPDGGAQKSFISRNKLLVFGGGAAVLILIQAVAGFILTRPSKPAADNSKTTEPGPTAAASATEKVRRAVEGALPGAACTWIDIDGVSEDASGVSVRLSGVAGSPVAAQQVVAAAAKGTKVNVSVVDAANVFPVGPEMCTALDAVRPSREPSSDLGRRLTSAQSTWALAKKNDPCPGPGDSAKVVVRLNIRNPNADFTVIGMGRGGDLTQVFASRAAMLKFKSDFPDFVTDRGEDQYDATSCYDESGLVGQLLVSGTGPFDLGLPDANAEKGRLVDADWARTFAEKAKANGWRTNMVWYRVVRGAG